MFDAQPKFISRAHKLSVDRSQHAELVINFIYFAFLLWERRNNPLDGLCLSLNYSRSLGQLA